MRQILFKAKLKNKDRWIEGFYCSKKDTTYCFKEDYERNPVETRHYIIRDEMTDWGLPNELRLYEIDPSTLCQYTGLADKNGNRIWENDIIKMFYIDGVTDIGTIRYTNECARFQFYDECNIGYGFDETCKMVVEGNVFDNPELLEEME